MHSTHEVAQSMSFDLFKYLKDEGYHSGGEVNHIFWS